MHVHHKNGRKIDNRVSNLQCLCFRCHANVDDRHRERLLSSGARRLEFSNFENKYPVKEKKESTPKTINGTLFDFNRKPDFPF